MMNKVQAKTLVFTKQPFIEEEEGHCRRAQWQFNALSQSEISKMAATQMFLGRYYDSNQKPLKGGVLDAHLGPAHRQCGDCERCGVKISDCPGHFGYLSNWDILQDEVAQYINSDGCGVPYQMQANTKPLNGLVQRLKGKTGCFHGNLCGKCVESTGRTVISPDSNLKITEVGIQMAQILSHPERLSHHNIDKLRQCVVNGSDKYPGSRMLKRPDVSEWSLRANRKLHADDVKYGDIVDRHLEHGYIVPLNRQPSFHLMSIMCQRARIMPRRTLRSNESVCNSYNADFDGDKMNMHVPQTEEPQTEAAMLMGGIRITGPEALYSGHVLQDLFDSSGTTNIAFTNGENIYVAVDSRITRDADNEIVDNEHYKFLDFNDIVPNIVGTQCGVSGVCKLIPKKIREMVEETGRISIQDVAGWVFNFLKTEAERKDATKERKDKFRRTTTILSTVDSEGPVMFIINCKNDGPIRIESDQFACCGSGSEYARSVLECRTDYLGMSNEDAIIWAQIALAYATRMDHHSGGTIRVRRITKDGVVEEISTNALQIFLKHYEKFNEVEHQIHCKANELVCETYRDSTLLVLRHPYKILGHEDMMRYIRVLGGQTRYCHSWGLLGGHLELTSIVLDGDHQEACARAEVILKIAQNVRAESRPSQRPKEPTYRMSWLIHDDCSEFILVGRGSDSTLRERLLQAYS